MHLNQSLRLVVDINRMHFLCMNVGSITLASTMCPYMALNNMIYFCCYHGPLRDFLPGFSSPILYFLDIKGWYPQLMMILKGVGSLAFESVQPLWF